MSYTMTHILVAEKVKELLNLDVDYPTYILGSTAPDAVHAATNYNPGMKERSHLHPERVRWGEMSSDDDLNEWMENIQKFYLENKDKYDYSFFMGYVVHLLTDVYACGEVYIPNFIRKRTDENSAALAAKFKEESYQVNYYLYKEYSKEKDFRKVFSLARTYSIEGIIDASLFEARTEQLFSFEFKKRSLSSMKDNEIVSLENTMNLINWVPGKVVEVIS